MFQYNKLSDFQYARIVRCQKMVVLFHFGLFWLGDIPSMYNNMSCYQLETHTNNEHNSALTYNLL